MKTVLQIFCIGFVFCCLFQAEADSTNSFRVTLELQDGSRVVGKSADQQFEFHSEILGKIKLALEQIDSIEFQPKTNAVKLVATNSDKLTVVLITKEFRIETSFGKVSIPADSIRRLHISVGGTSGRPKAGLVARWSGDGNVNDNVGGCNGQIVNGVQFTPGKVGQAFDFNPDVYGYPGTQNGAFSGSGVYPGRRSNRSGGYILVPASPALDVGKADGFTFECWIKPTTVAAQQLICEYARELGTTDSSDVGMLLAIQSSTVFYANVLDVNQTPHEVSSPANVLVAGVWQHIALTYEKDSGIAALYVNGVVVTQEHIGSFTPQTSFKNLLFGAGTYMGSATRPNTLFSGGIDEFGIYNRALSAAEIQAICLEGNNGVSQPH